MAAGFRADQPVDPDRAAPFGTKNAYTSAVAEVRAAAAAYYGSGEQVMDDDSYDALIARVAATERARPGWRAPDSPTGQVAAGAGGLGEVPHSSPMLGLDNVFDEESLNRWLARVDKLIEGPSSGYTVEPKVDGLAVAARYVAGKLTLVVTRGTGIVGDDVTTQARHAAGLPGELSEPLTVEVRGEVYMTDDDFAVANKMRTAHGEPAFAHPRGAAAGTLRAIDRAYTAPLSFMAYAVEGIEAEPHSAQLSRLEELGVATTVSAPVGLRGCATAAEILATVEQVHQARGSLGFGVDGAVIKLDSPAERVRAGIATRSPRWAIAYKFPADIRVTTLLSIDVQVGRTGVLTPVASLAPVIIDGVKVVSATLHNFDDLVRRDVRVGDTVFVRRAGDVIPEVYGAKLDERPADAVAFVPPAVCPRCGGDIDRSQRRWRCTAGRACGARAQLAYFTTREAMDIEGLGEKIVDQLVAAGLVTDPADLYDLTVDVLAPLEGLGEVSGGKLVAAIQGSKSRPLSQLLTGLGVRMAGRTVSRKLARHFGTMDALLAAGAQRLLRVDGIGPERAAMIAAELAELAPVIGKLAERGVNMTEPSAPSAAADAGALPLRRADTPMRVVVTGAVPGLANRDAGNQAVERLGGTASGSVSAKTDLVVVGEGAGSKAEKAEALGVPVLPAAEFAELLAAHDAGDESAVDAVLARLGLKTLD